MVAASKMRKAVNQVLNIRPYAISSWSVLTNLSRAFREIPEPLLAVREVGKILMIVVASNRGLCGSYNAQVAKKIKEEMIHPEKLAVNRIGLNKIQPKTNQEISIDFIAVGKKAYEAIRRLDKKVIASFDNYDALSRIEDIRPLVKIILDDYREAKYDKVVIVYTDFLSTIRQETKIRQILPISKIDIEKQIAEMDALAKEYGLRAPIAEYKVEPSPEKVLRFILPRLIEMQIFHAILESNASKESAQMMAMKNATEAAEEMGNDLTFTYNQIRQTKITQEIAEISAGRAALEN